MKFNRSKVGAVLAALFLILTIPPVQASASDKDWENIREQCVTSEDMGRTLIFSDSPEMAKESGILYRDHVVDKARIFLYHVNDTALPKRIVCLVTNESDRVCDVRISRWAGAEPSEDWLAVGRDTQKEYFGAPKTDRIFLAPHESRILTRELARRLIQPQELVHTIHDLETDQPLKVTILIAPACGDLTRFAERARVLPADSSHLRGTFAHADRYLVSEPIELKKKERVQITLADNDIDRYKWGIDATDGTRVLNYGNYGVVYRIDLPLAHGKAYVYLSPQGGLYAGGVLTERRGKQCFVSTPDNRRGYFGVKSVHDRQKIGEIEQKSPLTIFFSPPGASNLPVKLIAVRKK